MAVEDVGLVSRAQGVDSKTSVSRGTDNVQIGADILNDTQSPNENPDRWNALLKYQALATRAKTLEFCQFLIFIPMLSRLCNRHKT